MWDMMQGIVYPLLIDLHANINLGVLYDSKNELPIERSFRELVEPHCAEGSETFVYKVVSGAREVRFNFDLESQKDVV